MKNISVAHVSFPHGLFAVVYFFSPECFGCYARARKAWKSETVPLKRQILDAPPKAPPSLCLLSTFPLSSHLFSFFLSLSLSPFFPLFRQKLVVRQSCCCRHFAPDKPSRCPSFPPFLYPTSIHPSCNSPPLLFL